VRRLTLCEWHRPEPAVVHFLFPHFRVELLIRRTILTRQWDEENWPMVRQEFVKALALRSRLRKVGWWN
jgi:hypothetical protein